MKVLYLSHCAALGGAERSLLEVLLAVRDAGVEPMLICPPGLLMGRAAAAGITAYPWCTHTLNRSLGPSGCFASFPHLIRASRTVDAAVHRLRPDIVHLNSAQAMVWAGSARSLRDCRVVWHWRDFYGWRRLLRFLAGRADAVVAISEAIMAAAASVLGSSAGRIVLVRNGVADLSPSVADERVTLRAAMNIPANVPLVVMAGQSVARKGHAVLLEAFGHLKALRPDVRVWILCAAHGCNAGRYVRALQRQAHELGCGASVLITEGVEDIAPVLRASDVVAVPSLREPFGRIAVEAMLAERPVVASAVDGLSEIVADRETGILVRPDDPVELASALNSVLHEVRARRTRGDLARRRALQLFSVSRVAGELTSLYGTL
jgi:glycosyltransferase involved in cell wall biosynthesis